ncbi:MAG: RNA polymerase sigma factor [Bacteroidales bacterium]|nr:RNA polymerase sigma factor [Bacteroidales bacterium]
MSEEAFNKELINLRADLIARACSLSSNIADAEDLTHDTLVKAMNFKEQFIEGTSLKAWTFTIMKHIFINNYRRDQHFKNLIKQADAEDISLLNAANSIELPADSDFLFNEIVESIHHLEEKYKLIFIDFLEGYKYKEISEKYNLPIGTIKSRIFYARKNIMEYLSKF